MKRMILMGLLAMALPLAAVAGTVDFGNDSGTLTGSSAGLTLIGSQLTSVTGFNGMGNVTGNLGTVAFSTGSLLSVTSSGGATFNSGGSFTITANGNGGLPAVVIFSGSFSGQVSLTLVSSTSAGNIYTISGPISGTWYNGTTVNGATSQLYLFTGKNGWMGTSTIGSGDTLISTVPEPGTLGLLGTGLVGLAGVLRKKLKA